jgi:hypothetical protein
MKKHSIIILAFLAVTGCKSFDPNFLNPTGVAFDPKLPAMERSVENNLVAIVSSTGQTYGASPQDARTLFEREVSEIMTDPYSDKKGYVTLKVNTIENKNNLLGIAIGGFLGGVPFLLGVPTEVITSTVEVQIDVMDANRKLIGSYRGSATKKMKNALYNKNGNYRELERVVYLLTVKEAIQIAKTKIRPDVKMLNEKLNKSV